MVCRTPGFDDIQDEGAAFEADQRGGYELSGNATHLRLVAVNGDAIETARAEQEMMPVASSKRCSAADTARQRRKAAQRARAKRMETMVLAATAGLALVGTIFGVARFVTTPATPAAKSVALVTVAPGDTLWAVAQRYTPVGSPTAATVAAIRTANPNLSEGRALRIGQRILVPVAGSADSTQLASAK